MLSFSPSRYLIFVITFTIIFLVPTFKMPGKMGGKAKPLKKGKAKAKHYSAEDIAFKNKQKQDAADARAFAKSLGKKGLVKTKAGKKKKKINPSRKKRWWLIII